MIRSVFILKTLYQRGAKPCSFCCCSICCSISVKLLFSFWAPRPLPFRAPSYRYKRMHEGIAKTYQDSRRVHTHVHQGMDTIHDLHQILLEAFVCQSEMTWVALHTFVLIHNLIIVYIIILLNIIIILYNMDAKKLQRWKHIIYKSLIT